MTNFQIKVQFFWTIILFLSIEISCEEGYWTENSIVTDAVISEIEFTWTVTNFSIISKADDKFHIHSEALISPNSPNVSFRITSYSSGTMAVFYLTGLEEIFVDCELSMLTETNEKKYVSHRKERLKRSYGIFFDKYLKKGDIFDRNNRLLSNNDEIRFFVKISAYVDGRHFDNSRSKIDLKYIENKIFDKLKNFYNDENLSDVTLIVEDTKMPAHTFILAAISPIFADFFERNKPNNASLTLQIQDTKLEVMKEILKFAYSTKPPERLDKMALDIFYAADSFQIDILRDISEQYLCENINEFNVYEIYNVARKINADLLKNKAELFIASNSYELISTPTFNFIIEDNPKCIASLLQIQYPTR